MTLSQFSDIFVLDLKYPIYSSPCPLTEVNAIILEGNFNLYPDGMLKFKADSSKYILYVYNTLKDGTINTKPRYAIPFDQILAVQMVGPGRKPAPYRLGQSI